jgi:hypothetical protein
VNLLLSPICASFYEAKEKQAAQGRSEINGWKTQGEFSCTRVFHVAFSRDARGGDDNNSSATWRMVVG